MTNSTSTRPAILVLRFDGFKQKYGKYVDIWFVQNCCCLTELEQVLPVSAWAVEAVVLVFLLSAQECGLLKASVSITTSVFRTVYHEGGEKCLDDSSS